MLEHDDSPEAVGSRLRYLRKMAGLKREELAKKADVNPTSISLWENARSKNLQLKSINKLLTAIHASGIDCNQMWLLQGIGPAPSHKRQAATMEVAATDIISSTILLTEGKPKVAQEIQLFESLYDNAVVMQITHAGMLPFYRPGDIVGGLWVPNNSLAEENNCIIRMYDSLDVRRVTLNRDNTFNLTYTSISFTEGQIPQILAIKLSEIAPIVRVWHKI